MIGKMTEQSLPQDLSELLGIVKQLVKPGYYEKINSPMPAPEISTFMEKTLELYLLIQQNPTIKSGRAFKDYLNETSATISQNNKNAFNFQLHTSRVVRLLYDTLMDTFYRDEWVTIVCPLRSQLEAFKQIYKETSCRELVDEGYEEIDEAIRYVGQIEGGLSQDEIPIVIPTSHWWWWPNEPQR